MIASSLEPWWHFSGVFHPAVSHFPIALLMVAALVESWSMVRRQRKPHNTTLVCICIGAAAAVAASVLGWANADASGEKGDTFNLHKWLGIAVAALGVVVLVASVVLRRSQSARGGLVWTYRGTLFAAAGLVGLVGSLGGKLVHGDNYYDEAILALKAELNEAAEDERGKVAPAVAPKAQMNLAAAPTSAPAPAALVSVANAEPVATEPAAAPDVPPPAVTSAVGFGGGQIDYARDIEPIFTTHCVKCHNDSKKKGGYRLDSFQHVFAAGQSGTVPVLPGKSDESLLVKMIEGKNDFADSIMPPKGNPLTYQQITLIRRWIDEGAQSSSP